jgi:hypothetical protein
VKRSQIGSLFGSWQKQALTGAVDWNPGFPTRPGGIKVRIQLIARLTLHGVAGGIAGSSMLGGVGGCGRALVVGTGRVRRLVFAGSQIHQNLIQQLEFVLDAAEIWGS